MACARTSPCLVASVAAVTLLLLLTSRPPVARAQRRHKAVGDNLDDVIDNEEDEEWHKWAGKRSRYDDSTQRSPTYGFVKLRHAESRPLEEVHKLCERWTEKLRTGRATARFMPIDTNTLFINLREDDELEDVKKFVLDQPEAYEFMVNGQGYRRPGDPPLEQVEGAHVWDREQRMQRLVEDRKREHRRHDRRREALSAEKREAMRLRMKERMIRYRQEL